MYLIQRIPFGLLKTLFFVALFMASNSLCAQVDSLGTPGKSAVDSLEQYEIDLGEIGVAITVKDSNFENIFQYQDKFPSPVEFFNIDSLRYDIAVPVFDYWLHDDNYEPGAVMRKFKFKPKPVKQNNKQAEDE
ncbi:MAG: hypothetical protein DWQ10_04185 [Calditrichaeota bacterium]|nr:MAG: hypothetical protein DWQ10_04185 [Calditrichota bacterium]